MSTTAAIRWERPLLLRTGPLWSLYGVWYRHVRVYSKTVLANSTPPVLEPLFFFLAMTIGLGGYIPAGSFGGLDYRTYVASGMIAGAAWATGVFETTFGTYVRLVYQRTYDAMLGTHLSVRQMFIGELLFCATKGAVFSAIVLLVTIALGARPTWWCLGAPLIGAVVAYQFAALGLIVTSYVKNIANFNFFLTGIMTPTFFFSGTFFPVFGHHPVLDVVAALVPLTCGVETARALFTQQFGLRAAMFLAILIAYAAGLHVIALRRMERRVLG